MQHLNNDIFDLFQQAADNYALDPGQSDWGNIANKLNTVSPTSRKKPLQKITGLKNTVVMGFALLLGMGPSIILKDPATKLVKPDLKYNVSIPEKILKSRITPVSNVGITRLVFTNQTNGKNTPSNQHSPLLALKTGSYALNNTAASLINTEPAYSKNHLFKDETITVHELSTKDAQTITSGRATPATIESLPAPLHKEEKVEDKLPVPEPIRQGLAKPGGKPKNNHQFYYGIIAGTSVSRVSKRPYSQAGYEAGFAAGVRLNKTVAIEAGITVSKKRYSSEGKDFNITKVASTMQGMIIKNIESKSTFIELPVTAKFQVKQNTRSSFYVAAGLIAYVVKNETNNYNVIHYGVPENFTTLYRANNYNLPAVVSFSAGFQKTLSNNLKINIAPYINVPLQGIGVGSLPVTTAGLQVGIYKFHK